MASGRNGTQCIGVTSDLVKRVWEHREGLAADRTLGEVAKMRGKSPEETEMDLVIEDGSRVGTVYFLMSEDNATFQKPQQLATGVRDVFVNGIQVLKEGKHTGAKPGRFVRGPGWTGWPGGGACK